MDTHLTFIERSILEALSLGPKALCELSLTLGIREAYTLVFLNLLIEKKMISGKDYEYVLESEGLKVYRNNRDLMSKEVRDLLCDLGKIYFKKGCDSRESNLKVKKLWLSEFDMKVFLNLIQGLENFMKDIEKRQTGKTLGTFGEKKLVVWGWSDYKSLFEEHLSV